MNANEIIKICDGLFPKSDHDCGDYVVDVEKACFTDTVFDKRNNADQMIAMARNNTSGWISLGFEKEDAIAAAKSGCVVIAAMTSEEMGQANGHIAVVAGVDGETVGFPPPIGGTTVVPKGFARSLADKKEDIAMTGPHEVRKQRLTITFKAPFVRDKMVSYFKKTPTK